MVDGNFWVGGVAHSKHRMPEGVQWVQWGGDALHFYQIAANCIRVGRIGQQLKTDQVFVDERVLTQKVFLSGKVDEGAVRSPHEFHCFSEFKRKFNEDRESPG